MLIVAEGFEGFVVNNELSHIHQLHPSIMAFTYPLERNSYNFVPGRHGGLAFGRNFHISYSLFLVKLDPKQSHLFISFSYKPDAITTNEWDILHIYDTIDNHHATLSYNYSTETLRFRRRGNTDTILLSVNNYIVRYDWNWICLEYAPHSSNGRAVIYDNNGNVIASFVGKTTDRPSTLVDTFVLVAYPFVYFDDLIINDTIQPDPNNPYFFKHVPEVQIKQVLPVAPGEITEFSATGAPSVWEAIDDYPYSNLDYDYAHTNAADSRFLVRLGPTDVTGIRGVVVTNTVRRAGPNLWRIRNLLKPDPGSLQIYESVESAFAVPDKYFKHSTLWLVNPDINTAWTKEFLKNTQVGLRATTV